MSNKNYFKDPHPKFRGVYPGFSTSINPMLLGWTCNIDCRKWGRRKIHTLQLWSQSKYFKHGIIANYHSNIDSYSARILLQRSKSTLNHTNMNLGIQLSIMENMMTYSHRVNTHMAKKQRNLTMLQTFLATIWTIRASMPLWIKSRKANISPTRLRSWGKPWIGITYSLRRLRPKILPMETPLLSMTILRKMSLLPMIFR